MGTQWKSARAFIVVVSLLILCSACQGNQPSAPSPITPNGATPSVNEPLSTTAGQTPQALAAEPSTNGAAGQMPAYYDGQLFTVNMKEMPDDASASLIPKNASVNEIYATNDLDEEQDFIPVIDAIQGDGFNPLWRQTSSFSIRDLRLISSSPTTRSRRLPPDPILRLCSWKPMKCIGVRWSDGNRMAITTARHMVTR